MAWTEKYYQHHLECCEKDEGGYLCCCESTEHNEDSLLNVLKESSYDGNRVELIFRTEEDADQFYFHLNQAEYKNFPRKNEDD